MSPLSNANNGLCDLYDLLPPSSSAVLEEGERRGLKCVQVAGWLKEQQQQQQQQVVGGVWNLLLGSQDLREKKKHVPQRWKIFIVI